MRWHKPLARRLSETDLLLHPLTSLSAWYWYIRQTHSGILLICEIAVCVCVSEIDWKLREKDKSRKKGYTVFPDILHSIFYLQSLHVHLRWCRCLAVFPPVLCVQPRKVRLVWQCELLWHKGLKADRLDSDGWKATGTRAALYLLSQKFFHGLSEFCSANLAVTISIELKMGNKHITKNKKYLLVLNENIALKKIPPFLTSLKASLSSFTPIMSAVSARSLGPMSSTKSSKSTCPPTDG